MVRYRSKAQAVEAVQFLGDPAPVLAFCPDRVVQVPQGSILAAKLQVTEPGGTATVVREGDWVVKAEDGGVPSRVWVMSASAFRKEFSHADDETADHADAVREMEERMRKRVNDGFRAATGTNPQEPREDT